MITDKSTEIYNPHNTGTNSITQVHRTMEEQGKVKNLRKNMKTIYGGRGILAELQRMINIPAKNG